jgi:hypothetical protein
MARQLRGVLAQMVRLTLAAPAQRCAPIPTWWRLDRPDGLLDDRRLAPRVQPDQLPVPADPAAAEQAGDLGPHRHDLALLPLRARQHEGCQHLNKRPLQALSEPDDSILCAQIG